jgi:hypothetical protein
VENAHGHPDFAVTYLQYAMRAMERQAQAAQEAPQAQAS